MSPIASVAQWLDAHVTLEAVSGSISGDTHYYTLSPPFCKNISKKKKLSKKKKKSFELRDDLIPFKGTQATQYLFAEFSHALKKILSKRKKKKTFKLRDDLIPFKGMQATQYLFAEFSHALKKILSKKKKKRRKLLNYVMTRSLSRVRWQLSIFC